jgi:hypothetical protein
MPRLPSWTCIWTLIVATGSRARPRTVRRGAVRCMTPWRRRGGIWISFSKGVLACPAAAGALSRAWGAAGQCARGAPRIGVHAVVRGASLRRQRSLAGGCSQLRLSCRLHFRLIRVRSPTFAYYRVDFPTQSRTVAIEYEHNTVVLKIGRSAVRPRPWPPYLTCTNGCFLDLFFRTPSQLSARAILYRSGREWTTDGILTHGTYPAVIRVMWLV